ncbi:cyclase family protein [Paraburkholderia sp. MMS20-SJTR3]|uniref:Cyclase family protein n=1 Tax=Paraburkholderia sejongensis TaxID=2886946 RepID=A0ABS8K5A2_9BURK|nr:cyclase family protein [Paraburkholderia sp. MMS20-SJTR3]MCC8397063.1 cyclase family protein [Paraburkholderia sp. MMS20-SJTR3]
MRWKNRPEGSNWGEFGADDQLGRPNLLGTDQVLKGAREIRAGLSFCLSLPLDVPGENKLNPRRHPPVLRPTVRDGLPYVNFPFARTEASATDIVSDDQVLLSLQYSTQWDSLAHVGARFDADGDGVPESVYYNGYRAQKDIVGPVEYRADDGYAPYACGCGEHSHADVLGIENLAVKGMQGRGVLIDLVAHYGNAYRTLGYDDLMFAIDADRVEIEPGDMLVLRTGFAELLLSMNRQPDEAVLNSHCSALDGRDQRLLQWLTDSGIAALAADNYAVERYPARPPVEAGEHPLLPLHHHCLFKLGLPLGELWYLRELATWLRANGRSRFMLTAPPLRLPGAMGSPVTPIATV